LNEPVYQIFELRWRWSQDLAPGEKMPEGWKEGLPAGRFWNGISHFQMPRENMTLAEMEDKAAEWIKGHFERKSQPNVGDLTINVHYVRSEVWCLGWFNHFTYDLGQSNHAIIDSFFAFIDRTRIRNREDGREDGYHLMGAEDIARWFGWEGDGSPCRCDGCKKHGVIRINH